MTFRNAAKLILLKGMLGELTVAGQMVGTR